MQIHPEHSPNQSKHTVGDGSPIANAEIHEGNIRLHPWLIFIAWSSGVAFTVALFSAIVCYTVTREAKQVELQLMYTNALMIREGMVRPGDMVFGPEGNLEYDGRKFIKPKESKSR